MVYVVGAIGGALVLLLSVALIVALSRGPRVASTESPDPEAPDRTVAESPDRGSSLPPSDEGQGVRAESAGYETFGQTTFGQPSPDQDSPPPSSEEGQGARAEAAATTASEPFSPPPEATPASVAPAIAAESPGKVDLLSLIDPVRDAKGPRWTRQGSSLVCPGGALWGLVVPKPPPAGYRWTIVLERTSGEGSIELFLLVDGRGVVATLERNTREFGGLTDTDGRPVSGRQTARHGEVFHAGRPTTIVCTVTRSRVQVACDEGIVIDWQGSVQRLPYGRDGWRDLPGDRLAVTSYQGVPARIDRMELEEIDPGESIPYTGPPAFAGGGRMLPPPWARPGAPPRASSPSEPSAPSSGSSESSSESSSDPRPAVFGSLSAPALRLEDLPEAVRRSKESVCIIEHPLASGTGFVVGENLVATNAHVVDGAYVNEIECHFSAAGAAKCRASRVLYEDPVRDLCLLEVPTDLPPIPIVADHQFQPGEKVVIVGNPSLGKTDVVLRDAVTSGTMRAVVHTAKCDFYQIDGAVNTGSSGGPAINYDGAVVAVIAMKATDRGETEIRQALRKLGDRFDTRFGTLGQRGIAFGIPVSDLSRAIDEVKGQPESAVIRAGDRHVANALLQRMSLVGGINLIRLQVNVPTGVRMQANEIETRIRMGRIPAKTLNQLQRVELPPEWAARALRAKLEEDEVRKMVRTCEAGMEENVKRLRESDQFDPALARQFEALLRTVLETKRYADNPPSMYNAYAKAVNDQTDRLKDQIRRLEEQLEVAKAAYEN